MKIKILIFPFCLIISFIVLTMYAKPEFSAVIKSREEIQKRENTLSEIQQRNTRIEGLISSLNANSDKESLILSYLPNTKEEELIINSIFQSAVNSSLYLSNLGVKYEKKSFNISSSFRNTQPQEAVAVAEEPSSGMQTGPTFIDVMNVEFSTVGTYENIKSFLEQIYTMEKESNIYSINISKSESTGEQAEEGTNVNNLNAKMSVYFDNIPSLKLKEGISHPVFSQSSFNFSVIDELEKIFNRKIPVLQAENVGKSNPFLP